MTDIQALSLGIITGTVLFFFLLKMGWIGRITNWLFTPRRRRP
jgi:hypothetical protein